jgi:hypothetical protein
MNDEFKPLISLGDAARILGLRSSQQALRFLGINRVPLIRLGTRTIRVRPCDVQTLVERLVAQDATRKRLH